MRIRFLGIVENVDFWGVWFVLFRPITRVGSKLTRSRGTILHNLLEGHRRISPYREHTDRTCYMEGTVLTVPGTYLVPTRTAVP